MTIKEKLELSADIVMSVLSNTSMDAKYRLDIAPQALEDIFNKIDEIVKNNTVDVPSTDTDIQVI